VDLFGPKFKTLVKTYFTRLFLKNKDFLLREALAYKGFMQILMKRRNTGEKWTKEEKKLIKQHLKTMALVVPALIVFLPPGGSIFLPILVDVLDRRKEIRKPDASAEAPEKRPATNQPTTPPPSAV
jgi:hypothetical protein